ncbi:probable serine/threonine protein kinase IREH1 isoform X2 [Tanacetum coccineum]
MLSAGPKIQAQLSEALAVIGNHDFLKFIVCNSSHNCSFRYELLRSIRIFHVLHFCMMPLVIHQKTVLKKADMIRKNAVESILAERDIVISVRNPSVVRFFYSFTCRENLYLVMEYLNGGDLYSLLRNLGCLDEDIARIYIAEVVTLPGNICISLMAVKRRGYKIEMKAGARVSPSTPDHLLMSRDEADLQLISERRIHPETILGHRLRPEAD